MRPNSVRLHGLAVRNRRADGRGSHEVEHWTKHEIDESTFKDVRPGPTIWRTVEADWRQHG